MVQEAAASKAADHATVYPNDRERLPDPDPMEQKREEYYAETRSTFISATRLKYHHLFA